VPTVLITSAVAYFLAPHPPAPSAASRTPHTRLPVTSHAQVTSPDPAPRGGTLAQSALGAGVPSTAQASACPPPSIASASLRLAAAVLLSFLDLNACAVFRV
jgi:hypothetical protein